MLLLLCIVVICSSYILKEAGVTSAKRTFLTLPSFFPFSEDETREMPLTLRWLLNKSGLKGILLCISVFKARSSWNYLSV
jgi:hypothetical protein